MPKWTTPAWRDRRQRRGFMRPKVFRARLSWFISSTLSNIPIDAFIPTSAPVWIDGGISYFLNKYAPMQGGGDDA